MRKIIVIGSINMDIVSQVEKHPRSGETVKGKDFS
ncbi:MAG: Ribokinase [Parcubacteria group bacterium GW2011_GWA2_47_10b]|nr:MAG: Ribokinase [Parcubacteria group bacterium GW2011_GWA2_47_10b]KKU85112.1 MAG: Ribokinase [Parcubacteria group bacterium GW2011_GWA1_47_9]